MMHNSGTILEIAHNKTYVFTADYNVVKIKTKKNYTTGQQVTFSKKDKIIYFDQLNINVLKVLAIPAAAIIILTLL